MSRKPVVPSHSRMESSSNPRTRTSDVASREKDEQRSFLDRCHAESPNNAARE